MKALKIQKKKKSVAGKMEKLRREGWQSREGSEMEVGAGERGDGGVDQREPGKRGKKGKR